MRGLVHALVTPARFEKLCYPHNTAHNQIMNSGGSILLPSPALSTMLEMFYICIVQYVPSVSEELNF